MLQVSVVVKKSTTSGSTNKRRTKVRTASSGINLYKHTNDLLGGKKWKNREDGQT
jgi:hypothetical protein